MLTEHVQSADWQQEKHVPTISAPEQAVPEDFIDITARIGEGVAHPNTTEHHIEWISLYYVPDGESQGYQLAHADFRAHGQSTDGPNEGPAYTAPAVTTRVKLAKSGKLFALSYCNIHGLWQGEGKITIG